VLVQLPVLGIVPDLLLCVTLSLGFSCGYLSAAMVGMSGGLIIDILYGWPLGAMGFCYLLMGLLAGTVFSRFDTQNMLIAVALAGGLSLAKELLAMLIARAAGVEFSLLSVFLSGMLITALLTAAFMLPVHLLVSKLCASRFMRHRTGSDFD